MRLDKWIWAVRMVKSRTLASEFCKQGRVTLNGALAKPAKQIKVGDLIAVTGKTQTKKYQVKGFIAKQSGADKVAEYFTDLSEPVDENSAEKNDFVKPTKRIEKRKYRKDQGRPTKRDRRNIDAFKSFE